MTAHLPTLALGAILGATAALLPVALRSVYDVTTQPELISRTFHGSPDEPSSIQVFRGDAGYLVKVSNYGLTGDTIIAVRGIGDARAHFFPTNGGAIVSFDQLPRGYVVEPAYMVIADGERFTFTVRSTI